MIKDLYSKYTRAFQTQQYETNQMTHLKKKGQTRLVVYSEILALLRLKQEDYAFKVRPGLHRELLSQTKVATTIIIKAWERHVKRSHHPEEDVWIANTMKKVHYYLYLGNCKLIQQIPLHTYSDDCLRLSLSLF